MTSRGFEVKNSTVLMESLSNLYRLESSKPTANSKQKLNIDVELATAIPLDGHDYSNFRTAVGKLTFMATWGPDMQIRHSTTIHTSRQSHNRKQARSETIATITPQSTRNTGLRLEKHNSIQKGIRLNSLVVVTQIGQDPLQRAKVFASLDCTMYKES